MSQTTTPLFSDAPCSLEAGADLSAKQNHLVKVSSAKAVICASQGEKFLGLLANKPTAGKGAEIHCTPGTIRPAVVGANGCTVDLPVTGDTAGRIENAAQNDFVLGYALATGVEGETVPVFISSMYILP